MASLNVRTACSALPLDAGWYGDEKHKQTPLALRNSFISPATNFGPLSATISPGYPCIANKPRRAVIVEPALVEDIGTISIYLDFASTSIRNIPPLKEPTMITSFALIYLVVSIRPSLRIRIQQLWLLVILTNSSPENFVLHSSLKGTLLSLLGGIRSWIKLTLPCHNIMMNR